MASGSQIFGSRGTKYYTSAMGRKGNKYEPSYSTYDPNGAPF